MAVLVFTVLFSISVLTTEGYPSSGKIYTIQTGAYAFSKLNVAEENFEMLRKSLKSTELKGLRILKANSHYLVRIGKFSSREEAGALLAKIRKRIKDAFLLIETEKNRYITVKSISGEPGAAKAETSPPVHDQKKLETTREKRTGPSRPEEKKQENPRVFYTVQTGNFIRLKDAKEQYQAIGQALPEADRKGLRVERAGRYYSVRVGLFDSYTEARRFIEEYKAVLTGVILQAMLKKENILLMEDGGGGKEGINELFNRDDSKEEGKEIEAIIDTADSYLNTSEYGKAAAVLRDALSEWPDNPDLYALYGEALLHLGYPEKALKEYRKATELSPDVPEYHAGVGYSLLNIYLDRAKASMDAFRKALEIDPDNINALEGLGIVYVSIDRKDLATEIYYRLRQLDPEAAERLNNVIQNGIDWGE